MSRSLGIDFGDRRIGLALGDPMGIIASPLEVIDIKENPKPLDRIMEVCTEKDVSRIVVGLPINMDGTQGPRAEITMKFVESLRKKTEIPVATWDERLSSHTAEAALIEAGMRREKRKGIIDKVAAQVILQHYLDSQGPALDF